MRHGMLLASTVIPLFFTCIYIVFYTVYLYTCSTLSSLVLFSFLFLSNVYSQVNNLVEILIVLKAPTAQAIKPQATVTRNLNSKPKGEEKGETKLWEKPGPSPLV